MKIPKKIKIGGFTWEVKLSKAVTHQGECFGTTHSVSQEIYLDPDNTKQKQEQTFLHELLHALMWQTGLDKRFSEENKQISEEEVVTNLSWLLYEVIKENPGVFK